MVYLRYHKINELIKKIKEKWDNCDEEKDYKVYEVISNEISM